MFDNKATDWIDKVSRFLVCYKRKQNTSSNEALHIAYDDAKLFYTTVFAENDKKSGGFKCIIKQCMRWAPIGQRFAPCMTMDRNKLLKSAKKTSMILVLAIRAFRHRHACSGK